jgi:uncharacterized protein
MKFQPDRPEGPNVIHAATRSSVSISGVPYTSSVIVPSDAPLQPWSATRLSELTAEHMAEIVPLQPELVILGSGPQLRFAHPSVLRPLIDARIGVETMDTVAACRTYNILVSEGRRVVAALLIHD